MANADTLDGAGVNSGNALDAAKLQNNSETTKDKEQKRAMETASVSHDEEHQHAVISFAQRSRCAPQPHNRIGRKSPTRPKTGWALQQRGTHLYRLMPRLPGSPQRPGMFGRK